MRQVDIRLADEMQQVWSRIRRSPKAVDIIDKALHDVEQKIGELRGKDSPVDKYKLAPLTKFKAELEAAKKYDLFDRKEITDHLYKVLGTGRDKAQDKIQNLRFRIGRRELAIEQLKTKKSF